MFEQDAIMYAKKLNRDFLTFSEYVQVRLLLKMSQNYPLEKKKDRLASIEDTSTLPELINFKTQSSSINVIREIGVHYHLLGPVLLKDDNGRVTEAIKDQYHHNATLINQEILKMWLNGTGLQPIEWSTLISALEQIELPALARTIADNLQ